MIVTFAMLVALCGMLAFVLTRGEAVAWVRLPDGSWWAIPRWYAQIGAAILLLPVIGLLVWRLGFGLYLFSIAASPSSIDHSLEQGETIRWEGRQGIHAFGLMHWVGIGVTALVASLCLYFLWRSWTEPDHVAESVLGTSVVLFLGGFSAIGVIVTHGGDVLRMARDRMAVTDRRIIWFDRKGRISRELLAIDLIGAGFVEGDDHRGWVMVTTRRGRRVREIDLFGVPRPHEAVTAIEAMMRDHRQA
ncbi:hypothetical protein [Sphingomonas spermidinifaciens]|nr:hypothetical protein [Sphingomonas spermidinifaciens]